MCLSKSFKSERSAKKFIEGQILDKKMIVYKGLDKYKGKYKSPYMVFKYEPGQHYYQTGSEKEQVDIRYYKWNSIWNDKKVHQVNIHSGLHSSLTIKRALCHGTYAIKMIIPKGAKVWIDKESGDLVSTELIFPHQ